MKQLPEQPKNITYEAVYEPDIDSMVKALRILRDWQPKAIEIKTTTAEAKARL